MRSDMNYALTVFGGGTSGIASAYIASKYGIKTLLVEKSDVLGGAITQGLVVPCMKLDTLNINQEFSSDLVKFAQKYNARHTYSDGNKFWFNHELLKIVFDDMLASVNCNVLFSSYPSEIVFSGSYYIKLSHKMLSLHIDTDYIIDATANAEIFKILNCKFQEKDNQIQMPTLRFIITNINMEKFASWLLKLDSDRSVTTVEYTGNQIYLSTAYTWTDDKNWALRPVFSDAVEKGVLNKDDTAYFQVFSIPNMPSSLSFNCPRIFIEGDISDPFVYSNALIQARQRIYRLYNFCKKYLSGFENSYISHISDYLGVRESVRTKCKYTLTSDDIINNKTFENIAFASDYPIDVHSGKKDEDRLKFTNHTYQVPLETLISSDYPKLYAVGRIISADFTAQSAVRTQLNCFSMGEAVSKDIYKKINDI